MSMKDVPTTCPTKTLHDEPAKKDDFGPHLRVAHALCEMILGPETASTIGITGDWGVGKSTVIRLLKERLEEANESDECADQGEVHVWVFDAWAHEGDRLRRSFLESLIDDLVAKWISKEKWDKKLERLRGLHRHEHRVSTHRVSAGGFVIAFGALLIPVGGILLNSAIAGGATPALTGNISWAFWLGLALIIAPAILPVMAWGIGHAIRRFVRKRVEAITVEVKAEGEAKGKDKAPDLGHILRFLSWFEKDVETLPKVFSPLPGTHDLDVSTDSFEEGQPTSIEFAEEFGEMLQEAIGAAEPKRQLVIVLDNLDRLPQEQATLMWATLQPFIQRSPKRPWTDLLWILVTYDPRAMQRLGPAIRSNSSLAVEPNALSDAGAQSDGKGDDSENNDHPSGPFGRHSSYVDKTIRTEFRVPYPLFSDWREYLEARLEESLPRHDRSDFSGVGQLTALHFPELENTPTPRQIKRLVNSIGALHRVWRHEIPLVDMTYYAIQSRRAGRFVPSMKISPEMRRLLSPQAEDNLYSIHFGVERDKARQLRLGAQLLEALGEGLDEEIGRIISETNGAWKVLQAVLNRAAPDWSTDQRLLLAIATLVRMNDQKAKEFATELANDLSMNVSLEELDAHLDDAVRCVLPLMGADTAERFATDYAMVRVEHFLLAHPDDSTSTEMSLTAELVGSAPWPESVKLPVPDVEALWKICSAAEFAHDNAGHPFWSDLSLEWPDAQQPDWLIQSFPGDVTYQLLVRVALTTKMSGLERLTAHLVEVVKDDRSSDDQMRTAVLALLELSRVVDIGSALEAAEVSARLSTWARGSSEVADSAAVLILAPEGYSEAGASPHNVRILIDSCIRTSAELGLGSELVVRLLSTTKSLPPALARPLVRSLIGGERPGIPVELIIPLSDRLVELGLLARAVDRLDPQGLEMVTAEAANLPFSISRLRLYEVALERVESARLARLIREQLPRLDETEWTRIGAAIRSSKSVRALVALAGVELSSPVVADTLGVVLSNQVRDHLDAPWKDVPTLVAELASLDHFVASPAGRAVGSVVYDAACKGRHRGEARFFKQYGTFLAASTELRKQGRRAVDEVLIPMAVQKGTRVAGFEWLAEALKHDVEIISRKGKAQRRRLLKALERRLAKEEPGSQARPPLEAIIGTIEHTLL